MSRQTAPKVLEDDDSSMIDADQENDESRSPAKAHPPKAATPRRPQGAPVPLGELTLEDPATDTSEDDEEPEYPPSPRKSPAKSPMKRPLQRRSRESSDQPESSRAAAANNITPPNNLQIKPLAEKSPFVDSSFMVTDPSPSPRKQKGNLFTPGPGRAPLFPVLGTPRREGGIFKQRSPSSSEKKREEERRRTELQAKLWDLCGRDVGRWNRGEFYGEPFAVKAKRW
jgi:ubiquitin-conjugating enzyme E2 S